MLGKKRDWAFCQLISFDNIAVDMHMSLEKDTQIKVAALLSVGLTPKAISRPTVYAMQKRIDVEGEDEAVERKTGSGKKAILDKGGVRAAVQAEPAKILRVHAVDFGIGKTTMARTVKNMGGKSLVMLKRTLLMPHIKANHLQHYNRLLNNMKSASARCVLIFSDEKT